MIQLPRRRFLTGLIGLIATPAIVKATSLMPVTVIPSIWHPPIYTLRTALPAHTWRMLYQGEDIAKLLLHPNDIFDELPYAEP